MVLLLEGYPDGMRFTARSLQMSFATCLNRRESLTRLLFGMNELRQHVAGVK